MLKKVKSIQVKNIPTIQTSDY